MSKKKYKICLLVQGKQHYLKLQNIAEILKESFNITFLVDLHHYDLDKNSRNTSYEHIDLAYSKNVIKKPGAILKFLNRIRPRFNNRLLWWVRCKLLNSKLSIYWKFIESLSRVNLYNQIVDSVDTFFKSHKFDCLIIAEANVEYTSEAFIKYARNYGIPSIIIPYTFCLPTEPAKHYYNDPGRTYRWYHRFFIPSKWVYKYNGKKLIRMYAHQVRLMDKVGITPPQPWVQESSTADALIVESPAMEQHYLSCNLKPKQLQVIGDEVYDYIFMQDKLELKQKILKELKFRKVKDKVITFAVFPDIMYKYGESTGFKTYKKLLTFICDQLNSIGGGYNIILCLHPTLQKKDFKFLENNNIKISSRKTIELIAISDLFVASISSTIRWAILLNVPVINYDCYHFRYDDFKDVGGVVNIESRKDFVKTINKIKRDSSYVQSLALKQVQEVSKYGIMDGKFSERLHNLIIRLITIHRYLLAGNSSEL